MNRILYSVSLIAFFALFSAGMIAKDKSSIWIDGSVGYGFGVGNTWFGQNETITKGTTGVNNFDDGTRTNLTPSYTRSADNVLGSLGAGLNAGLSVGICMSDYFDFGIGANYISGGTNKVNYSYRYDVLT